MNEIDHTAYNGIRLGLSQCGHSGDGQHIRGNIKDAGRSQQSPCAGKTVRFAGMEQRTAAGTFQSRIFFIQWHTAEQMADSKYDFKRIVLPILIIWVVSQIGFHFALSTSFYHGFPSKSHDLLFYLPIMHLNQFLIGNLAGLFFINNLSTKKLNTDWFIIVMMLILFALLKYNTLINFHNGFLMIIFIPIILLLSINNGFLSRFFNNKICVLLGEISYGIYILQIPIFAWVKAVFSYFGIQSNLILFYCSLIILIVASAISYLYIETPL